jgi:hypothetical protein
MSAFIVNSTTLQSIAAAAFRPMDENYSSRPIGKRLIEAADASTPGELYEALYKMNEEAFCQRYPGNNGERTRYPEDIGFEPWPGSTFARENPESVATPRSDIPALVKNVNCLVWQCSEGNVPETPLFKALGAFGDLMAQVYIQHDELYEQAPWG